MAPPACGEGGHPCPRPRDPAPPPGNLAEPAAAPRPGRPRNRARSMAPRCRSHDENHARAHSLGGGVIIRPRAGNSVSPAEAYSEMRGPGQTRRPSLCARTRGSPIGIQAAHQSLIARLAGCRTAHGPGHRLPVAPIAAQANGGRVTRIARELSGCRAGAARAHQSGRLPGKRRARRDNRAWRSWPRSEIGGCETQVRGRGPLDRHFPGGVLIKSREPQGARPASLRNRGLLLRGRSPLNQ